MTQHPLLQSSGNRVYLAIAFILVTVLILFMVGEFRENARVAACKEKGGTPIYQTKTQEFPINNQGSQGTTDYQFFDHCQMPF
ncbi:MAG TPA: hypothetical protein V6C78_28415 [Crinalium sp.]